MSTDRNSLFNDGPPQAVVDKFESWMSEEHPNWRMSPYESGLVKHGYVRATVHAKAELDALKETLARERFARADAELLRRLRAPIPRFNRSSVARRIGVILWVASILTVLWFGLSERAKAQDLVPCLARGRTAFVIVMAYGQGTPLNDVTVEFHKGEKTFVTDGEYVNSIREEIRPLVEGKIEAGSDIRIFANLIAHRVAAACAYGIGRDRVAPKGVDRFPPQSVPPEDPTQSLCR